MHTLSDKPSSAVNQRLTALWAMSEAGLGGLLHLFKLPFTGILVGGFALLSVAMLAWHNSFRAGAIIRSWIIVMAVKFGLSPHSPVTAYIAVSFQAFFSQLCFRLIPNFSLACMVSGTVCTVESALQRVIVLTLVFGMGLWKAVDAFTAKTLDRFGLDSDFSGSQWLIGGYLAAHALAGLGIGWWASRLPRAVAGIDPELLPDKPLFQDAGPGPGRKPKSLWRQYRTPVLLLLAGLALYVARLPGAEILLRGAAVWLGWTLLVQKPLQALLLSWVRRNAGAYETEVNTIRQELPDLRSSAQAAWSLSRDRRGLQKLARFSTLFFAIGLQGAGNAKPQS